MSENRNVFMYDDNIPRRDLSLGQVWDSLEVYIDSGKGTSYEGIDCR